MTFLLKITINFIGTHNWHNKEHTVSINTESLITHKKTAVQLKLYVAMKMVDLISNVAVTKVDD